VIEHKVVSCNKCEGSLKHKAATHIKKQVFEVQIKSVVIEHRAEVKFCGCGQKNVASFPSNINAPVQYGNSIVALSTMFSNQFIPAERTAQLINDLTGLPISDTTVLKFQETIANNLMPIYNSIEHQLKDGPVKFLDETGFRINNKTSWLHVMSSSSLTHYRVDAKRGSLLQGLVGTVVHDHWKPYFKLENVDHALCNAHHLRELKAICEFDNEPWAPLMSELLILANSFSKKNAFIPIDQIYELYGQIITIGLDFHERLEPPESSGCRGKKKKRPGHNLLVRLRDFKTETLRFLIDPLVPFTNNQAEQDLRMMKIKQKISGCFRTMTGAQEFCITRSFVSSLRKQGLNIFQGLVRAAQGPIFSF
jgi:transposase